MQSNQAACAPKLCQEHVHKHQLAWQPLPSNSLRPFRCKFQSRLHLSWGTDKKSVTKHLADSVCNHQGKLDWEVSRGHNPAQVMVAQRTHMRATASMNDKPRACFLPSTLQLRHDALHLAHSVCISISRGCIPLLAG